MTKRAVAILREAQSRGRDPEEALDGLDDLAEEADWDADHLREPYEFDVDERTTTSDSNEKSDLHEDAV